MKTVSKARSVLLSSAAALALALLAGSASAQTAQNAPAPAAPDLSAVTLDVPAPPPGAGNAAARAKNLSGLEEKVTDATKNVVKQLSDVDNVNLEDLNAARQAVVKLEVLIDIEKHLAELDKIHAERNNEKSLASSIPASALLPAPGASLPSIHNNTTAPHASANLPSASFAATGAAPHGEVTQIAGADGHYSAVIQGKTFRVGDTLPDGSMVVAIATKEVTVKKDGAIKQLKIKGVDEVYGHTL